MWGKRYREYYSMPIRTALVDLDTLYGGLSPTRKGGGNQSRSLRLQTKDGKQYVMRALRKSAVQYLQAIVFKNEYVQQDLKGSALDKFVSDFYTGSHPYAPFVIEYLAKAANIYHTKPKLFYVPKQPSLGAFNNEFGDELYMIEEHVSEGHKALENFGNCDDIISTDKLLKRLAADEKYKLDASSYIRARMFDMLLGDWDRHPDQWRWAEFKENGQYIYRPIPRDRDQAFSDMGDGYIMGVSSRAIPGLALFEGFSDRIQSVKGLNASPKTYALDMALLSETNREDWIAEAEFLINSITRDVVEHTFDQFPPEVQDHRAKRIKFDLLLRKRQLVTYAEEYFELLNRYSIVKGTNKDDHFDIQAKDKTVTITVYRKKKGKKKDVVFSKVYNRKLTKEIWLYGMNDDDTFEVRGKPAIYLKVVGGNGKDEYVIDENTGKVKIFDFESEKNTFDLPSERFKELDNNHALNHYQFLKNAKDEARFLPIFGFNPDDGVKVGGSNLYTYKAFHQNPFTKQYKLSGLFLCHTRVEYLG